MKNYRAVASPQTFVWIATGAALFVAALIGSAWVVPQLRLLHSLQALIYLAVVILARHNSALGFGAGVSVAVVCNGLNLFVTHLIQAGALAFWAFLETGPLRRLDTILVPLGGLGHFILIISCLAALFQQPTGKKKWLAFLTGSVVALAYLVMIVAIAGPAKLRLYSEPKEYSNRTIHSSGSIQ